MVYQTKEIQGIFQNRMSLKGSREVLVLECRGAGVRHKEFGSDFQPGTSEECLRQIQIWAFF